MKESTRTTACRLRRRTLLSSLGVTAAALTLAVSTAGSAHAATSTLYQGSDWGRVSTSGDMRVCDEEADGRGVYMVVSWETGTDDDRTFRDSNGSASGCAGGYTTRTDILNFKVCEVRNNLPDSCASKWLYW